MKFNFLSKYTNYILLCILVLMIVVLGLSLWIGFLDALRMVFGSLYVLFLPGFMLVEAVFPKHASDLGFIEKITLSFAVSIAVVPLTTFYLSVVGIKITLLSTSLVILGITTIGALIILWKNRAERF